EFPITSHTSNSIRSGEVNTRSYRCKLSQRLLRKCRRNMRNSSHRRTGFTLIELVVVVVIIAIIAAIAIPKMSRGSAGAADSAVSQALATVRSALELFQTEHGGTYPSATSAT